MLLVAEVSFWGDGVGCFCHEALLRGLDDTFGVEELSEDVAHRKYRETAEHNPHLANSSWQEFLRNGPRYHFRLSNGVSGRLSRYRLEFDIAGDNAQETAHRLRQYIAGLKLGEIKNDPSQ